VQEKIRYTLGKDERLKSRKAIEQLFKDGKAFSVFPLRVLYMITPADSTVNLNKLQAGFSVSTRNFKKAVDRNRIKRLLKESYRLQKNELDNGLKNSNNNLLVFFIYTDKEIPDLKTISDKIQSSIKRLQKIVNESNIANT
jgi:ribonuclease P protein component